MKYFITIGFIFYNILVLVAQSDFRDGYLISNNSNNDTIHGLIDYKGNTINARKCVFKVDVNSEKQTFTPDEIKGFRFINSKYYVSKQVVIGNEIKQLFLEYLINGIIDIYYYRDDYGEHYLVDIDNSGSLYELKNEEKEIVINNIRHYKLSKEYIGLLKYTFRESPSISNRIENINLNHKSLIKISHDYHKEVCSDEECIIYEKKLPKIKSTYGIVVGLSGMLLSQTGEFPNYLYYLRKSQFGFKIFPSVGIYYKVNIPSVNERLFFQYEGTYSFVSLSTINSYTEPVNNMSYVNDISLTQNMFNNLGCLKYEFPRGKIRPTFHLGGFANHFFKMDYNRNLEIKTSLGNPYLNEQISNNPFSNLDYGINCGFGIKSLVKSKEVFIDLKYKKGFGLIRGLNTYTYLIVAGYQIGKN